MGHIMIDHQKIEFSVNIFKPYRGILRFVAPPPIFAKIRFLAGFRIHGHAKKASEGFH